MKKYLRLFFTFYICVFYIILYNYTSCSSEITGVLLSFQGNVDVFKKGRSEGKSPKIRERFCAGDYLVTGKKSNAKVLVSDGAVINVAQLSKFTFVKRVEDVSKSKDLLHLISGKVRIMVKKITGEKSSFEISTPTALCAVRGTDFIVSVNEREETNVAVLEGRVKVEGRQRNEELSFVIIPKGKMVFVDSDGIVSAPLVIEKTQIEKLLDGLETETSIKEEKEYLPKRIMWSGGRNSVYGIRGINGIESDIMLYGPSEDMLLPGLIETNNLKRIKKKNKPAPLPPPHP